MKKKKKRPQSLQRLLAQQKHHTAVSSIFYSIVIIALLVIGLMLLTTSSKEPPPGTQLVMYQALNFEENFLEPTKKVKVQLHSTRPQRPSSKIINLSSPSNVSIPLPKCEVPSQDFDIGADIESLGLGNGHAGTGNASKGKLSGIDITANQLGIVLDISGSMSRYLPTLEKEINRNFPWAITLRVPGCRIMQDINQVAAEDPSTTITAIKYLVEIGEVDAIFWFCDLEDFRSLYEITVLAEYLKKHEIKLYLRSTSLPPDSHLMKAVTKFSSGT